MNDHALCAPSKESSAGMSRRMKHALSADNGSSSVTRGDHVRAVSEMEKKRIASHQHQNGLGRLRGAARMPGLVQVEIP